jgi:hypothetical protein
MLGRFTCETFEVPDEMGLVKKIILVADFGKRFCFAQVV